MYAVTNSSKRFGGSEATLYLTGKLVGPLVNLQLPKYSCEPMLVYESPELSEVIKQLIKSDDSLFLKHESGYTYENLLIQSKGKKGEKITTLVENSQLENFPYLLDPDYKFTDQGQKKWASFQVLSRENKKEKIVARMFIHQFRAVFIKRTVRKELEPEATPKIALLFILLGERNYVQYILKKVELVSTKFPTELLSIEMEDTSKLKPASKGQAAYES